MPRERPQRIRDPLHNLIVFGTGEFEHTLWRVLQTRPFQRLRRIRQLGFSDLVYPGATHSRFAHSVGVFHTARILMRIIEGHIKDKGLQFSEHNQQVALAAALLHDIGHGMHSHAFEDIGKKQNLTMAHHEHVTKLLIQDSEITGVLCDKLGSGFANDVATLFESKTPKNLYAAVVSSQFDADRLDYMRRDRLMSGVQNSAIDFDWLIANLEVGTVKIGVDDQPLSEVETFVLGPKAIYAAETYVLALFQLYPTIYFHKTTRAAEKVFTALMMHLIKLVGDGSYTKTGLPETHPIVRFAKDSDSLANALALDDTVFWGALPMLAEAPDLLIQKCAISLLERKLPKCIDIHEKLLPSVRKLTNKEEAQKRLQRLMSSVKTKLAAWQDSQSDGKMPRILLDEASRTPYKPFGEMTGRLNQILIRSSDDGIRDMAESSNVVSAIEAFELFRAYVDQDDKEARAVIASAIEDAIGSEKDD